MIIRVMVKQIGKRKPIIGEQIIALSDRAETLQQLVEQIVALNVEQYNSRAVDGLIMQALTERQIEDQADKGKVGFGMRYNPNDQSLEKALENAELSFRDGLYKVFINDAEIEQWQQPIELQDRMSRYFEERLGRLSQLGKRQKAIAEIILREAIDSPYFEYGVQRKIDSWLWRPETRHIGEVFQGDDYEVLTFLLGDDHAAIFKKLWDRATLYPYSQGYLRRSFRSNEATSVHLGQSISRLCAALQFAAHGLNWRPEIVDSEAAEFPYLHDYIGYELDEGNGELLDRLRAIIYDNNASGRMTRNMIKGMLMSRQAEAHVLIGELLKAAKLQEGLRQSIAESMDESSREGFIYMLGLIIEEEMWRFSSIVRAFDVWTGLPIAAYKPAVMKKCLTAAYDCLTNDEQRVSYLENEDSQLLYIALWATAFDEAKRTEQIIAELANDGPAYRKIAALQFLLQCQAAEFQYNIALLFLKDPDFEVAGWAVKNIDSHSYVYRWGYAGPDDSDDSDESISAQQGWQIFEDLRQVLERIPGKEMMLRDNGLLEGIKLTTDEVCCRMLEVAYQCGDRKMCEALLKWRDKMQAGTRASIVRFGVRKSAGDLPRSLLLQLLGDKSPEVRHVAGEAVASMELTAEERLIVEDLLQYKAGDIRKTAVGMLLKQPETELLASIRRLLADKKEEKRLGGLDLAMSVKSSIEAETFAECAGWMKAIPKPTMRESVLIDQLAGGDDERYSPENGFGLFDPDQDVDFPTPAAAAKSESSWIGRLLGTGTAHPVLRQLLSSSPKELQAVLAQWSELIHQYRDYEYEAEQYDGSRVKHVLGTMQWSFIPLSQKNDRSKGQSFDDYPLPEVWRELVRKQALTAPRLVELLYYFEASNRMEYGWSLGKLLSQISIPDVRKWFDEEAIKAFSRLTQKQSYTNLIRHMLEIAYDECDKAAAFETVYPAACEIYVSLQEAAQQHVKPLTVEEIAFPKSEQLYSYYDARKEASLSNIVQTAEIGFWLERVKRVWEIGDHSFEAGFQLVYQFARINEWHAHEVLDLADVAKALERGVITDNEMYRELLGRPAGVQHMLTLRRHATRQVLSECPKAEQIIRSAVQRVVEIELKRGDSDTWVSRFAQRIDHYEGMAHLVQCLHSLGEKASLVRGYSYSWGGSSKQEMLSHLLKGCHAAEGEDAQTLRLLLERAPISERRLIEAAMYAPQWVTIIEEYLGWEGFSSACWYFHAHVSQYFSGEKETIVARYSPISPEELNDGAFDIDWFFDAYRTIGEERFQIVYDSAKYISDGANHRRSQLFADAVLGRLDAGELERELSSKRNKNHVLCYGLIPLPEERKQEALIERYETLMRFAKESKQFGAQRRESESRAVQLGLENLARGAGYSDVTRMIWRVEAEQFKQLSRYFEPEALDEWQIFLRIDELGSVSLQIAKDGKLLSSVPSRLKKHETVLRLKEVQKQLKDQQVRSRAALEKAMVMHEAFTASELIALQDNKVIAPLIQALVFRSEHGVGYWNGDGLQPVKGPNIGLAADDSVWIAHPVHLYESGHWAAYQRDLMIKKIKQPFKQVFRELYRPTEDELLEGTASSRYAGHQIQPRKAAALFRARQWTVSHEEGLQKVFHKQDIFVTLYAMADWFSPADVEAPTIEKAAFYSRRTGKPVHLSDIPSVLFSEIMRDIDLAVSVAHVGGVDPEASLSTVDMRAALVRELLPLLKHDNVQIKGSHAHIAGALGEYTVHLGSGVVHRMAAGALYIIPVHSQHRGKLFLPFVDEDPRTAEVVSKILLLAEDKKIKDPGILEQLG